MKETDITDNGESSGVFDGVDGRPEVNNDRLLARLKKVHGEPRYDLAVPLKGPLTLKKRPSKGHSHAIGKSSAARDMSRSMSR